MNSQFNITISDPYCTYAYKFSIPEDIAIYDIVKAIAGHFDVEMPEGIYIGGKNTIQAILEQKKPHPDRRKHREKRVLYRGNTGVQ